MLQFLHYPECTLLNSANQLIMFKCVEMSDTIPEILMKEKGKSRHNLHKILHLSLFESLTFIPSPTRSYLAYLWLKVGMVISTGDTQYH